MDDPSATGSGTPYNQTGPSAEWRLLGTPFLTLAILMVCVGIWALLNFATPENSESSLLGILAPSTAVIWRGAFWALLTCAFVHLDGLHLLFNMWWTRDFGRLLEPRLGLAKFAGFIATSAMVSSGSQLVFSGQTGIGFSGVVYAFFGYMLAARKRDEAFQRFLSQQTILWLLGWLVFCIIMTRQGTWNIGNAAHIGGFVFGFLIGVPFQRSFWPSIAARIIAAALLIGGVTTAFYMPWSANWRVRHILSEFSYDESTGPGARGLQVLRRAAEAGHVPSMNLLAWYLATDTDETLRDGASALEWATKACNTDGWTEAAYIDTLAAAHAELKNWDKAVEFQKMAIEKVDKAETDLRKELEDRLRTYEKAHAGTKQE